MYNFGITPTRQDIMIEGLQQKQLYLTIGYSLNKISLWETGEAIPAMEDLVYLAHAMEAILDELGSNKELIENKRQLAATLD